MLRGRVAFPFGRARDRAVSVCSRVHSSALGLAAALLGLAWLLAACSGEITAPASGDGLCDDCVSQDGVFGSSAPDGIGPSTRFPKLSNRQWENTVQALFLLDSATGIAEDFTQEPLDKGYEPLAAAQLTIGGDAWSRYQTAAENVASMIIGDDAKLAKITPSGSFADANAKGTAFISAFGRRAYRRPLTRDEQGTYLTLFKLGPSLVGGDAFQAGARLVIEAMLQSPHFLYRVESSEKADRSGRKEALSGYEVASRLSYALWNSMPSDQLLDAAAAGELDSKEGVARWAGKLLDDGRAHDVLVAFHEQTFQVASYGTQDKDPSLGFDADALAPLMQEEARRFFEYVVIKEGGGIAQLLTEPVAFANATTAPLYGVSGVTGSALQQVSLDASQRAGLLTQLGFLTKNATRSGSDPVHRGLIVARKVLCDDPDPPPMMFELPKPQAGLTTRQIYEQSTACGKGCHDTLINPPGFAFEIFDAVGRFRSMEAGQNIDPTGTLQIRVGYTSSEKKNNPSSALSFDGPVDMVKQLAALPRVHECYAREWMQYMLARDLASGERGAWESLARTSQEKKSARALILDLVQLDTFRMRAVDAL